MDLLVTPWVSVGLRDQRHSLDKSAFKTASTWMRDLTKKASPLSGVVHTASTSPSQLDHTPLWPWICWHIHLCVGIFSTISLGFGIIWSIMRDDVSTGFTVSSYILALGGFVTFVLSGEHNTNCIAYVNSLRLRRHALRAEELGMMLQDRQSTRMDGSAPDD